MAWALEGNPISAPTKKTFKPSTQQVTRRPLSGAFTRDYIGDEKMIIDCEWENISKTEYDFIKNQYDEQRLYGTNKSLAISDISFSADVIIDMQDHDLPYSNHYDWRKLKIVFYEI